MNSKIKNLSLQALSAAGNPVRILIIEDQPEDAQEIQAALADHLPFSYELTHRDRLTKVLKSAAHEGYDVILTDLVLPDSWGRSTFEKVYAVYPETPIIVLSGSPRAGVDLVLRNQAFDCFVKGRIDPERLVSAIQAAVEKRQSFGGSDYNELEMSA